MISESRVDLRVPFVEKDEAKQYGARFDWERKVWFVPPGIDLSLFSKWLQPEFAEESTTTTQTTEEKGIALSPISLGYPKRFARWARHPNGFTVSLGD